VDTWGYLLEYADTI